MSSPVRTLVPPAAAMTFAQAVQAVLDGHKIARSGWNDGACLLRATVTETGWPDGKPAGEFLAIRYPTGKIDAVMLSAGDLDAADWTIVKEH